MVLDTPVTYFDKDIFGQLDFKRDLYHHIESHAERARVRKSCRLDEGSNEELMGDRLIEVNLCIFRFTPHLTLMIFF